MPLQYFKDFTKAYLLQSVSKKIVTENLSKKCKLLQNVHCCCSVTQSCPTLCDPRDSQGLPGTAARQASLSLTISQSLLNSCALSRWCHQTISSSVISFSSCFQTTSSSVVSFSSCFQYLPMSGSFPVSWLFASGVQNIVASASASVLPMNIQD